MPNTKKLYIIPGFGESTRMKKYGEVIKRAKKFGFSVVPVDINWDWTKTMSDFIKQADKQIPNDISTDYVFGFSFGTYIASILSQKKNAKGYIFCSASPYYREDLAGLSNEVRKEFGKKMLKDFEKFSFPQDVKTKAWFLVGSKEPVSCVYRTKESYKNWSGKKQMFIIEKAEHDLKNPNYLERIEMIIRKL